MEMPLPLQRFQRDPQQSPKLRLPLFRRAAQLFILQLSYDLFNLVSNHDYFSDNESQHVSGCL